MQGKSLLQTLMSFAKICKGKMILAVLFAVVSVFGGIVPFFGIYGLLDEAIEGGLTPHALTFWCLICAGGFLVQVLCYAISTIFAHISAYTILEQIRLKMAKRLLQAPLGEITAQPAGKLKDIFLDKVSNIELPLAHVIPEVGSSLLLPLVMFFLPYYHRLAYGVGNGSLCGEYRPAGVEAVEYANSLWGNGELEEDEDLDSGISMK